jgi:hypothetical protein
MALYQCEKCGASRELRKTTICIVNGKAQAKEALCGCGEYMQNTKEFTGFATVQRPSSDTNHVKSLRDNE